MRDLTKRFISEQERTDISNLVKQIENKTSGEDRKSVV